LILTTILFIVISKGSERVAEVAARFTLDAMPGKQISIDAELGAVHIGQNEARRRRDAPGRESQLFGSMDGAMKSSLSRGCQSVVGRQSQCAQS
jgi:type III secretion protein V